LFKNIKSLIDTSMGICSNSERLMGECSHASKSYAFSRLKCFASALLCNLPGGAVTLGSKPEVLDATKAATIQSL
jgi:hypothetical protein